MPDEISIHRVDLDFTIKLPANAHDDCPHLIEARRKQDGKSTTNLTVADVICTIMMKCNPLALHDLLNMDITESFYSLDTFDHSHRGYVARSGHEIVVFLRDFVTGKKWHIEYAVPKNKSWGYMRSYGNPGWVVERGRRIYLRSRETMGNIPRQNVIHNTAENIEPESSDHGTAETLNSTEEKNETYMQLTSDVTDIKVILQQTLDILVESSKKENLGVVGEFEAAPCSKKRKVENVGNRTVE
ncbi:hypothetical protein SBOR_3397 [Sclerotinia borealis F-4128]|uniref:Uncharacterized protein n=1 Tax=Sclerotinia borealis (strain F-4128) TaxID=1432307 RepID=W9CNL4_SCLBF|nr:hypothetical protein SBOR_3397 [Sclerotinia borealis F-4128]